MTVNLPVADQDPWDETLNTVLSQVGNQWVPDDYTMAAWSMDPALCQTNGTAMASGFLHLVALKIRKTVTVTGFAFMVATPAVTPVVGQNFIGLYDQAGTLLMSAAIDTQIAASAAAHRVAATPTAIGPGTYRVGVLTNAATGPIFLTSVASTVRPNLNLPLADLRVARQGAGLIALPGSAPAVNNAQASDKNIFLGLTI